jgi:hypothetical protein
MESYILWDKSTDVSEENWLIFDKLHLVLSQKRELDMYLSTVDFLFRYAAREKRFTGLESYVLNSDGANFHI